MIMGFFFLSPMFQIIGRRFFMVIFSNIIENAIKMLKNRTSNNMFDTLSLMSGRQNYVYFEISNNGNPFPRVFDLERFKIRGEKTTDSNGEGIGGADIYKLDKQVIMVLWN